MISLTSGNEDSDHSRNIFSLQPVQREIAIIELKKWLKRVALPEDQEEQSGWSLSRIGINRLQFIFLVSHGQGRSCRCNDNGHQSQPLTQRQGFA